MISRNDQIEELKKSLQSLQEELAMVKMENKNLRDLIEYSPDPMVTGDSQGKLNFINKAFTEISGYSVNELKSINYLEYFDKKEMETKPFRFDLLNENKLVISERNLKHKSGREIPVEMKTIRTPDGEYQTVYRDISYRIQELKDLSKKEKKFRQLFENMTNGFALHEIIFDDAGNAQDYRFLEVNPAYVKLTGVPPERIIGNRIKQLIPHIDAKWLKIFEEVVKTGKSIVFEDYLEPLQKHFEILAYRTDVNQFAMVFSDITSKKKAEIALHESEETYRKIVENIPLAISIADFEGNIKYQNGVFDQMFGYKLSEINTVDKWFLLAYPDKEYRKKVARIWNKDIKDILQKKDGIAPIREYQITDVSGNIKDIEIGFSIINKLLFVTFNDITNRKKAERKLYESQEMLRTIIDSIPDLVYAKDTDSRFLVVNKALSELLNTPVSECLGKTDFDFFPKDIAIELFEDEKRMLRLGVPILKKEEMFTDNYGKTHIYSTSKIPIRNPKGKIIGFAGSGSEITERKKAENATLEAQRMLKTVMDSIPIRIFWKDRNSVFLGCNKGVALDNGLSRPEEVIGKTDIELSRNMEEALAFIADDQKVMESGIPRVNYEEQLTTPAGTIWLSTSKVPLRDNQGNIFGVLGTYDDITEKKKIAQALFESEQRLKLIIRNAPLVLFNIDKKGIFTFSDGKGLEKLGLKPGEVVGSSAYNLYKDYPKIIQNIKSALKGESVREIIHIGDLIFNTQIAPLLNSAGKPESVIGVSLDITEKVMADKALFEIENRIGVIVSNSPIIIYSIDKNGIFTFGDGKGLEKLGLQKNELVGHSVYELYKDYPIILENIQKTLQGIPQRSIIDMGEIIFDSQYTPVFDENGQVDYIIGVSTDISERVKASRALKESEEKFRLLAENLPGVIYMCKNNKKWTTLYMNDSIFQLLGYTKEQFYSEEVSFYHLYHPEDRDNIYKEVKKALLDKKPFHLTYRVRHANGQYIWLEEVGDAIRKKGKVQYLEGYMSDITNLKNYQQQLEDINSELEERVKDRTAEMERVNKELSEFAYVVSHDLKAPLRGINQLAEWLSIDFKEGLGEKGSELVDLLKGRVNRLENLINAILEYSRAGRPTIKDEAVDIERVVQTTIEMLAPPPSLAIIIDTPLPVIKNNKIQMGQVFQNLIGNAIKFMDKENGQINVGWINEMDSNLFYIKDNGPGIEQKYYQKVFQIFQTLTSRDVKENTGVGLALVKKIIELYGGTIWIESEKGIGSTFTFRLPKQKLHE